VSKPPQSSSRSARPGEKDPDDGLTRRTFLGGSVAAGSVALAGKVQAKGTGRAKALGPKKVSISLNVNGRAQRLTVEPRVTLLRGLRNHLSLTGTKEICNGGACGGCSVLVDGVLVNSCMMLALDAAGKKVTTIEGLSNGNQLHPIQQAFVKQDALQCGFCTPGMVMACKALLDGNKNPNLTQIKKGLSGNLCRCGTYPRIFAAVQSVGKDA
jgi:xanthine dehydrogenase YagT iron-sulfur-binding subunit